MNMKPFMVGCSVVVVGLGLAYMTGGRHTKPTRFPSGKTMTFSANIKTLMSIPLMKGVESPRDDEGEVAETLIKIFDSFANRNRGADGGLHRATHNKGTCFHGRVTIFSDEELRKLGEPAENVERLHQGFFSYTGMHLATLRFANADGLGRHQSDKTPDVRGFSFTVQVPEITDYTGAHRQDFMFNSTPAFAAGGVYEFHELVKLVNILTYHDLTYIPSALTLPAVLRDAKLGAAGNSAGGGIVSYATEEFWGNLPYSHGIDSSGEPKDIVKFKVTPCDGKGTQYLPNPSAAGDDYLQADIVDRAKKGEICFNLQVQFFDLEKLRSIGTAKQKGWNTVDWVEEGGLLWDEKELPFHTVGQVKIAAGAVPISCDKQYINTRLHSYVETQPLGSIARVRTLVEENSRARRMKEIP